MTLLLTGVGNSGVGVSYIGPGNINGAAAGWWGLRSFSTAYATGSNPAVDLVDQAGLNPITINIKSNGDLDVAAINTWVTANTVTTIKVKQLYDQSGNLKHVSQATLAAMPVLTLNAIGTLPGITFAGATSTLNSAATTGPTQAFTISYVAKRTAVVSFANVLSNNSVTQTGFDNAANGLLLFAGSPIRVATYNDNVFHSVQNIYNAASSSVYGDGVNNASLGPGAADFSASNVWTLGAANSSNSNGFTGVILECGLWAGDKSANNATMYNGTGGQKTYWGF